MREPWDLAANFIGQANQQAANSRATADNALFRMIAAQLARQDAATQQQYGMDTLAQRNVYSTAADTTAFERQLQRDNQAYGVQDARRAEDRQWAVGDAAASAQAKAAEADLNHQRQLERIQFTEQAKNFPGGQRRFGNFGGSSTAPAAAPAPETTAAVQGIYGPRLIAGGDLTLDVIRGHEGFRGRPYWDVNADRIGYGSDTVTLSDGTVQRVTKGTRVTLADAERDLARRAREFQSSAIREVGQEAWNKLSPGAHAALTSITYNYGSLPKNVAAAVRTGDPRAIAQAIASRGSDNGGVNAKRRQEEAQLVLNGGGAATGGARRHTDQSGQQDATNAVLSAPVSNSAGVFDEQENVAPVSSIMSDYLDRIGMEPVSRVKLTEAQLELLPDDLKAMLMTDIADVDRSNSKGPTEWIMVQPRAGADISNAPMRQQLAQQPIAPIEVQPAPKRTFKDGRMVLEDGSELTLTPN